MKDSPVARCYVRTRTDVRAPSEVPSSLRQAAETIGASRGQALQLRSAFDQSPIPMVLVDNERRYKEVNPAARLLARMSLQDARSHQIGDYAPPEDRQELTRIWAALMERGSVSGRYHLTFRDGAAMWIFYAAIANALPGQHLVVLIPADWPGEELDEIHLERGVEASGTLSRRQLEVLRLVAVGANASQIATELSISEATVRTHVKHILERLGAHNRAHAVAVGMTQGLLGGGAGSEAP